MATRMFSDKLFQAHDLSIVFDESTNIEIDRSIVKWMRPKEICDDAIVLEECGASPPIQGSVGNCWFISVCFVLSQNEGFLKRLFSNCKDFSEPSYNGTFTFNLWDSNKNEWVEVTIDDRLPTIDRKLIFGSCQTANQFWLPLLEKACAKFYGCYESLSSGQSSEAFMLLTSGHSWTRSLNALCSGSQLAVLKQQIKKVTESHGGLGAVISTEKYGLHQQKLTNAHYYVVAGICKTSSETEVELWNPWAGKTEERQNLFVTLCELCQSKSTITFVTEKMEQILGSGACYKYDIMGLWIASCTCGGSYDMNSYSDNPQYIIKIGRNVPTSVYVGLIQTNKRKFRKRKDLEQAIGIHAWKVSQGTIGPYTELSLKSNPADFKTQPVYQYRGDVSLFCFLPKDSGDLLVMPSTFAKDINCGFMLRVCTSSPATVTLINRNNS